MKRDKIVVKDENAGYQCFLVFSHTFSKCFLSHHCYNLGSCLVGLTECTDPTKDNSIPRVSPKVLYHTTKY